MGNFIAQIVQNWRLQNIPASVPAQKVDIELFQEKNKLKIPLDMIHYFETVNGTNDLYDESFFKFYSLKYFERIDKKFHDWEGIPNYKDILNSFPDYKKFFVFADYQLHLFSYAIHLNENTSSINQIYVICGNEFKIVAQSFTEFLELYLKKTTELFL